MQVTKVIVYQGYEAKFQVPAPEYGEGAFFTIASPSLLEVLEAKKIRLKLSKIPSEAVTGSFDTAKLDIAAALEGEEKARLYLVQKALTRGCDAKQEWSEEDIAQIKPTVFQRIWSEVDVLIGWTASAQETVKNFPKALKDKK